MSGRARVRRWLLDVWPCLPFVAVGLIGTEAAAVYQPDSARDTDALAYVLMLAAALALATHRLPGLALTLNGAAVTAYLALGYPYGPVLLTAPAAAYLLAERWPLRRAALAVMANLAVLIVASGVKRMREPGGADTVDMWWQTLMWGTIGAVVVAVGAVVRARREAVASLHSEKARRAVSEERLRVAQDLHDTIGHRLAVIAMQLGVALHVLDRSPQEAKTAMRAARATSRESLDNLRAVLETMRAPEEAVRPPAPGLGDLDQLVDRVRSGGVAVRVDLGPDLPPRSSTVDAVAYRIVQESLTNVLRHAGAATTARVRIRHENDTLLVDVTNTGPAGRATTEPTAGGTGIRGMHALAASVGGTLRAEPRATGGFTVAARLPLRGGGTL